MGMPMLLMPMKKGLAKTVGEYGRRKPPPGLEDPPMSMLQWKPMQLRLMIGVE